ncbi:MAG: hypothetical protein DCC55_25800 [Chloroflexi bacterium]|nr:MAG: hypothetical protein DCC55_25800 [Chloroflexota bacterium]
MTHEVSFEWRVVEDADWHSLPAGFAPAEPGHRTSGDRWLLVAALRAAVILSIAWLIPGATHQAPLETLPPTTGLAVLPVLEREAAAWQSNDLARIEPLLAPEVRFEWRNEWRTPFTLATAAGTTVEETVIAQTSHGDMVQVTLLVHAPTPWTLNAVTYRETRYYRPGEQSWLRTLPPPSDWGEEHTLETPHLRYQFRTRDTEAVLAILDRNESVYLLLHELLELDPSPEPEKLTIRIDPRLVSGWAYFGRIQPLTSPALARVPHGMSDADYLAHSIANRVTGLLLNQLTLDDKRGEQAKWQPLVWAINGWMRTDLQARRSPWHRRVETMLDRRRAELLPFHLADILDSPLPRPYEQRTFMHQYLLIESLVGYILTAYGRDQLPGLLAVLRDHGSWQVVPEMLLGIAPAEFEDGWNRFVATHYLGMP